MSTADRAPTALVVDDDPVTRRLVVHGLKSMGFDPVLEAEDGKPAMQLLQSHTIDVAITDLEMREMDGLELIDWAQEHVQGPIWIILSAVESFDTAVEAIHVGAFDFLSKPPDLRKLEVALRNALRHRDLILEKDRLVDELQASSIELLEQVKELQRQSETIRKDLERAEVIQRALLPAVPPEVDGVRILSYSRPGEHIGGDLYDVVGLGDDKLAFYIADATGHGVSAAMLAVMFKRHLSMRDRDGGILAPSRVLELLNQRLAESVHAPGLFLTAAYGVLDCVSGVLRVASAGHTPLVLLGANAAVTEIPRTGPALALSAGESYRQHELVLEPGDRLLLYTDGLLDGFRTSEGEQARDFLVSGIREAGADETGGLRAMFDEALRRFREVLPGEGRDDITLLMLARAPGRSAFDNGERGDVQEVEAPSPVRDAVVWQAESEGTVHLALRGRATWTQAEEFYTRACQALSSGRQLDLDLSGCEYMDSTFLGTVHEIVCRAQRVDQVRVVAPPAELRALFEELCMERTIACMRPDGPAPSTEWSPVLKAAPARDSQLRLLRAHETLTSLGERNREKFQGIVDALRAELASPTHPRPDV